MQRACEDDDEDGNGNDRNDNGGACHSDDEYLHARIYVCIPGVYKCLYVSNMLYLEYPLLCFLDIYLNLSCTSPAIEMGW